MENLTLIPYLISGASLVFSIISLILTYRQRSRQDDLSLRKSLTDSVSAIADTNIQMEKLKGENFSNPNTIAARRIINSQRRYLANHAELLISEIPKFSTDIDHNLIAGALDAVGDYERARKHWVMCVEKSPEGSLHAMNLRGFARFMFTQGNPEQARKLYEDSLQIQLSDTDGSRRLRADTLMMWALAERDFGFSAEGERRYQQSIVEASRVGTISSREELLRNINNIWNNN